MKRSPTLLTAALGLALALPLVASAAQTPATSTTTQAPRAWHHHHPGMMGALRRLDLSDAQRTQIRNDIAQFKQQHPKGSAPDPQARKALHEQIMGVLTPDQQAQLKTSLQQERARHRAFPAAPAPTSSPS